MKENSLSSFTLIQSFTKEENDERFKIICTHPLAETSCTSVLCSKKTARKENKILSVISINSESCYACCAPNVGCCFCKKHN